LQFTWVFLLSTEEETGVTWGLLQICKPPHAWVPGKESGSGLCRQTQALKAEKKGPFVSTTFKMLLLARDSKS
jgi:hypothetical protein